jgi:hypothetical protein
MTNHLLCQDGRFALDELLILDGKLFDDASQRGVSAPK